MEHLLVSPSARHREVGSGWEMVGDRVGKECGEQEGLESSPSSTEGTSFPKFILPEVAFSKSHECAA